APPSRPAATPPAPVWERTRRTLVLEGSLRSAASLPVLTVSRSHRAAVPVPLTARRAARGRSPPIGRLRSARGQRGGRAGGRRTGAARVHVHARDLLRLLLRLPLRPRPVRL